MTADEILKTAANTLRQRGEEYDASGGERSMQATVEAFNAITGRNLREEEGWAFMAVLKLVRAQRGQGTDSYVDGAAYFALMGEANA